MKTESLKLRAYNVIKEKIINCEYAPHTLLNEESLRVEIGASRTPIRDALSRLEQEGLIVILPKKGVMVSGLSISEINMIFEVRLLVEPFALLNCGDRLSSDVFLHFYNVFSKLDSTRDADKFYVMDDNFHITIVNALKNRFLLQTYDNIQNQNLRFRVMTGQVQGDRLACTNEEHLRVVRACLKKDWALAAEEMRSHLLLSKNSTFDLLLSGRNVVPLNSSL